MYYYIYLCPPYVYVLLYVCSLERITILYDCHVCVVLLVKQTFAPFRNMIICNLNPYDTETDIDNMAS